MNNAKVMELVGKIMMETAAKGDPVLAGMVGELMTEISAGTNVDEVIEDTGIAPAGKQYVVCVEATRPDGTKVQHPLVGGGYTMPDSIDDVKMTTGTDLDALKRQCSYIEDSVKSMCGAKVNYILLDNETISSLEERLRALLQKLSDAIDAAAKAKAEACGVMNVDVDIDDISDDMLRSIIRDTLYAGSAVDASGNIVERQDGEKYAEENGGNDSYDGEDDDEDNNGGSGNATYDEEEDD